MIRRLVSMFAGGLGAALASQAPEFQQQYAQRLGGAVDELKTIVEQFDLDARRNGTDRNGGLTRLQTSGDSFVQARGVAMQQTLKRFEALTGQQAAMTAPDVITRVGALVKDYDPQVAAGAWKDFRPAVPLTAEGALFALIGFVGGSVAGGITALPMGRRRRRETQAA
jgi:Protein of unknown function (DUF2937)